MASLYKEYNEGRSTDKYALFCKKMQDHLQSDGKSRVVEHAHSSTCVLNHTTFPIALETMQFIYCVDHLNFVGPGSSVGVVVGVVTFTCISVTS